MRCIYSCQFHAISLLWQDLLAGLVDESPEKITLTNSPAITVSIAVNFRRVLERNE